MATRVVSKTINLDAPSKEISKYITKIDDNGIKVHPINWSNNSSYVQIDGDGFTVWDQAKKVAQYGQDAIIGDKNGFHIEITANYESYFLSNDTTVNSSKTYYIENNNEYQEVLNPSGNPHENNYYERKLDPRLSFYRNLKDEVAYISGDKLYITQSVVLQQMDVGETVANGGLGQWSWKVHEIDNANNLYLKWLG